MLTHYLTHREDNDTKKLRMYNPLVTFECCLSFVSSPYEQLRKRTEHLKSCHFLQMNIYIYFFFLNATYRMDWNNSETISILNGFRELNWIYVHSNNCVIDKAINEQPSNYELCCALCFLVIKKSLEYPR